MEELPLEDRIGRLETLDQEQARFNASIIKFVKAIGSFTQAQDGFNKFIFKSHAVTSALISLAVSLVVCYFFKG